jgi:hypothetical protein
MTRWRHALWPARALAVVVAYQVLLAYADSARSLEAVLGLSHGDAAWHALVACAVIALRLAAWATLGATLVGWPLEAWLRRRALEGGAGAPVDAASPRAVP